MGFDIWWARLTEEDAEPPEGAYFRAASSGWGELVDEMTRQGMTYETPFPESRPQWEDYGVETDEDGEPDESSDAYRAWLHDYEAVLAESEPDAPGLPTHKLAFNEGFVLTPNEIDAALAHAARDPVTQDDPDFTVFWCDWLDYLRRAAREGGGARVT